MKAAAAHFPGIGRTRALRLVVTCVLLFAFALQSYVTQTHVHGASAAVGRGAVVDVVGKVSAGAATPTQDDAVACPFCQAIAAAGAFFSPAVVALAPRIVQAEVAVLSPAFAGLAIAPAGFSWRSRAPPQP